MRMLQKLCFYSFLIAVVFPSCTIEKRKFQPGYHFEWQDGLKSLSQKSNREEKKETKPVADVPSSTFSDKASDNNHQEKNHQTEETASTAPQPMASRKLPVLASLPVNVQEECDLITLLNGEEIQAKIVEIGTKDIRYKKCDNLDGPDYILSKAEVFMVKYPNGTKDIITPANAKSNVERKTPGLATAGMIMGIIGLIIAGIPLGLLALVFGAISYGKIIREPEKYKGKGIAIASIILGSLSIILTFLVILLIL
jgi:hypothetical protein